MREVFLAARRTAIGVAAAGSVGGGVLLVLMLVRPDVIGVVGTVQLLGLLGLLVLPAATLGAVCLDARTARNTPPAPAANPVAGTACNELAPGETPVAHARRAARVHPTHRRRTFGPVRAAHRRRH